MSVMYVVVCTGCQPALPIPFSTASEMGNWVTLHVKHTEHTIVCWQEQRPDGEVA